MKPTANATAKPSIQTGLPGPQAKTWVERDQTSVSQHYQRDYPLETTLLVKSIAPPDGHGSTFGGKAGSGAAALATLDLLEGGLSDNAAMELVDPILKACFGKGLILLGCGESSIRFAPPLIATQAQADIAVSIFNDVLSAQ